MATTNLGYQYGNNFGDPTNFNGHTQDSEVDNFNKWLRVQPWYVQYLRSIGQDPASVHLSDGQRKQLSQVMEQNGAPVSEDMNVDSSGNVHKDGHLLRNLLIGGGLAAGAVFGGPSLVGLLGHLLSGGAAAGTAGAAVPALEGGATIGANLAGAGALGVGGAALAPAAGDFVGPLLSGATGSAASGGTKSAIGSVLGNLLKNPQGLADVSSMLGSYAQQDAANRLTAAALQQSYDKARIDAAAATRSQENDAMRKLYSNNYIESGGFKQPSMTTPSGTLPFFDFGARPASQNQIDAAKSLDPTLMSRMTPAGAITATDPSKYLTPSNGEKAANYGSLITSGLGAFSSLFK
jgi:hypothetical protein